MALVQVKFGKERNTLFGVKEVDIPEDPGLAMRVRAGLIDRAERRSGINPLDVKQNWRVKFKPANRGAIEIGGHEVRGPEHAVVVWTPKDTISAVEVELIEDAVAHQIDFSNLPYETTILQASGV